MAICPENILFYKSIIPEIILQKCLDKEEYMQSMATLIINIGLGEIKQANLHNYKNFDANPSDGGCQSRAAILLSFLQKGSFEELNAIKVLLKALKEKKDISSRVFFENAFKEILVSKKVSYLCLCYFLTQLKVIDYIEENGVIVTKCDVSKLTSLSKKIDSIPSSKRKSLLEISQIKVSEMSTQLLEETFINTPFRKKIEKTELIAAMLSEKYTRKYSSNPKYLPKNFRHLFYQIKALFCIMQEIGNLICINTIFPKEHKNKAFQIFFRFDEENTLIILSDEEIQKLPSITPIITIDLVTSSLTF